MHDLKKVILLILVSISSIFAQELNIKGKIVNKKTGENLSYANVVDKISGKGTSSNINGEFNLKLPSPDNRIVASYIGFISDTLTAKNENNIYLFELEPISLKLEEVTVFPGENPALAIMKKAIEKKNERLKKITDYSFTAFTKGIIKTDADMSSGDNSISMGLGGEDGADTIKIDGILENVSTGYFKSPDSYKEEIVAQRQTQNFPSSVNILTGNRVVQSFYNDDIKFFGRPMVAPLEDAALDYYFFYIKDTLAIDNKNVFNIHIEPYDSVDPGFVGDLYIADKDFSLLKVDVTLNEAANFEGIFSKVQIFQQFVLSKENIYMPVDYRLFIEGGFLGLIKFGFEINTIMYDYNINKKISDDFFDWTIIKVQPGAADVDSLYWNNVQTLPYTDEEKKAYKRIDSVEAIEPTFADRFSFFAPYISLDDHYTITGPLTLYYFNKVEGNGLNFEFSGSRLNNRRLAFSTETSYGFANKKFKWGVSANYLFGDYRTFNLYMGAHDRVSGLFEESIKYNRLTSTILSLFTKYDFRDYYYEKGFYAGFKSSVFNFLDAEVKYELNKFNTAIVNTDFSFFKRDQAYRTNKIVNDGSVGEVELNLDFDFRRFIEDGYFRRRVGGGSTVITFGAGLKLADKNLTGGDFTYTRYSLNLAGRSPLFRTASFNFRGEGFNSNGATPLQKMYSLAGNISSAGKSNSFRTLGIGESFGDKGALLNLNLDLRDELFRMLSIPLLKDSRMGLTLHVNSAIMEISQESKNLIPYMGTEFPHPFYEAGFGIRFPIVPMIFEFTWKLNYRGKNDFVFGINTFAL